MYHSAKALPCPRSLLEFPMTWGQHGGYTQLDKIPHKNGRLAMVRAHRGARGQGDSGNREVELMTTELRIENKRFYFNLKENQKGISYDKLFSDYIKGAEKITITDAYIRIFYQIRNLMEFIEMVIKHKEIEDEVQIHLVTIKDDRDPMSQLENFEQIRDVVHNAGIVFTWEFDNDNMIHARHIVTDNGWKISLDRGLDIFQHYEMNNSFDISNRLQEFRGCKGFEVTYIIQK